MNIIELISSAFRGPAQARAAHRTALRRGPSIEKGIDNLRARLPVDQTDDESPIFLLSAGWRSGSTMVQRLLMSDPDLLVWGEPYDECGFLQALAGGVKAFRDHWPPADYFYEGQAPSELTGDWIANLFPSLVDLRRAHRAFFDTLFAYPARAAGAVRWGLKEVRLTAAHAQYLQWIYPRARFLLLYRNPLEAYRSYAAYGRSWYDIFPERPVFTPWAFGTHWRTLMEGYLAEAQALDALLLRYEDLIADHAIVDRINAYLGTRCDPAILRHKVGGAEKAVCGPTVSYLERRLLQTATAPLATQLGYRGSVSSFRTATARMP